MAEHMDTAPVWAVYRETASECPLCALAQQVERGCVESFLGGSVMEPLMRIAVNEKGFCAQHFLMLYDAGNRLGVALMADTYLKAVIAQVQARGAAPRRLLGKRAMPPLSDSCILCERLNQTMARYGQTLAYLWAHEAAFRQAFAESKGVCLKHYDLLANLGDAKFQAALNEVTLAGFEQVERDLAWFTQKFDYKNQAAPWGNSRDAVARALVKLRGVCATREAD
ncbi:MAG: DUF6062 family protein [Clostridia bacterium]